MHYYQFNKPSGCVTAMRDEKRPTIMKYLETMDMSTLRPVGRLDMDTEGLLILTDDGDYNQKMTHPMNGIEKEYYFFALGTITEEKIELLRQGISLSKDGEIISRAALLQPLEILSLQKLPKDILIKLSERSRKNRPETPAFSGRITVTEGKKHEVKRLLKGIGAYCIYLKRLRIGSVTLYEDLKPGEVREFTPDGGEEENETKV